MECPPAVPSVCAPTLLRGVMRSCTQSSPAAKDLHSCPWLPPPAPPLSPWN